VGWKLKKQLKESVGSRCCNSVCLWVGYTGTDREAGGAKYILVGQKKMKRKARG